MSQEKVAEDLQAFLKRVEDMARQRNLNIFVLAESRGAKKQSGTATMNVGMSRKIREAGRWYDRFKKQNAGTKMGSFEDGRDMILGCAGLSVEE